MSPVRRDTFHGQQLRLMRTGEKPLEHSHLIPALCFCCLGDTYLESKYISLNLLPAPSAFLHNVDVQILSPEETRRTSAPFRIGKKTVYRSLQPIIRFFPRPTPAQPLLALASLLPDGVERGYHVPFL